MEIGRRVKAIGIAALTLAVVGTGLAGIGRSTAAQDAAATPVPPGSPWQATVSVSGDGSVMVEPDAASVSIGVNTVNANLAEAQAQNNSIITEVLKALKAAGIADKDIQTSSFNVNLIQNYDNNGMPGEITGYQVNNQLNVTVRDLDKLGEVLETAIAKGANSIYGITFMVTDSSAAESQARKLAVADATKKAQELAGASGATLGRIITISETASPGNVPIPFAAGAAKGAADSVAISTGTNTIVVNVQITFELIQ